MFCHTNLHPATIMFGNSEYTITFAHQRTSASTALHDFTGHRCTEGNPRHTITALALIHSRPGCSRFRLGNGMGLPGFVEASLRHGALRNQLRHPLEFPLTEFEFAASPLQGD